MFQSVLFFVVFLLCINRKSTKRVLELEIQLENSRVGSPVSSANADSNQASDSLVNKDVAALKIRIKSMEREMQQKKLEAERMEIKLTEQSRILFILMLPKLVCLICNFVFHLNSGQSKGVSGATATKGQRNAGHGRALQKVY